MGNRTIVLTSGNLYDPLGEAVPVLAVDNHDGTYLIGAYMHRWSKCLESIIPGGSFFGSVIDMSCFNGGVVHIPFGWTSANLAFQMSAHGDDFNWLMDKNGELIQIAGIRTDIGACYVLPSDCWSCGEFVRPVSKSTTSKSLSFVSQVSDTTLHFSLKS